MRNDFVRIDAEDFSPESGNVNVPHPGKSGAIITSTI
jgi:hypothetical protein